LSSFIKDLEEEKEKVDKDDAETDI